MLFRLPINPINCEVFQVLHCAEMVKITDVCENVAPSYLGWSFYYLDNAGCNRFLRNYGIVTTSTGSNNQKRYNERNMKPDQFNPIYIFREKNVFTVSSQYMYELHTSTIFYNIWILLIQYRARDVDSWTSDCCQVPPALLHDRKTH